MLDPKQEGMTFAQVARLDPDEQPGELDAGRWIPLTRGTWRHGRIVVNVAAALKAYSKSHPGWSIATADPGVKLNANPDRLRGPDVGVIRAEREPTGTGVDGWLEGAPDVVVEVVGDSQSISEMTGKALEYITSGARLVWIVDPEPQRILIFTPPDHVRMLGPHDSLDGGDVLPGFTCPVAELFE